MRTTNLRKVGDGTAVERGHLVAEPQKRPRHTLERLLARCHPKARRTKEERDWLISAAAGNELV